MRASCAAPSCSVIGIGKPVSKPRQYIGYLHQPRLVVWVAMTMGPASFALMGPVCSSWGLPNRATSRRDYINWQGGQELPYVAQANVMISRILGGPHCFAALYEFITGRVSGD